MPTLTELREAKAEAWDRLFGRVTRAHQSATGRGSFGARSGNNPLLNIIGVGLGYKSTSGSQLSDLCVKLLVRRKLPPSRVSRAHRLVKNLGGIPSDVVECGNIWCTSNCPSPKARAPRPFPAGVSISSASASAGCAGYPILRKGDPDIYLLSNYHVLGAVNGLVEPTFQPGKGDDDPRPGNRIGKFAGGSRIRFGGVAANLLDAAIARVDAGTVRPELCGFGPIPGIVAPRLNRSVWMFGKESRGARGDIEDVDFDVLVGYSGGRVALFKHQVRIAPRAGGHFGLRGDSGSIVVDLDTRHACALFFARDSSGFGFASPISRVLRRFQARLA